MINSIWWTVCFVYDIPCSDLNWKKPIYQTLLVNGYEGASRPTNMLNILQTPLTILLAIRLFFWPSAQSRFDWWTSFSNRNTAASPKITPLAEAAKDGGFPLKNCSVYSHFRISKISRFLETAEERKIHIIFFRKKPITQHFERKLPTASFPFFLK